MILVDSSVWIDLLGHKDTPQTVRFRQLLASRVRLGVGDLVAVEVLQGTRTDRVFQTTLETLQKFPAIPITDPAIVVAAAHNYRNLRARGITVRKTIDTLIATRCIEDDLALLYADRDFDPFVQHLGLRSALDDTGEI